MAAEQKAVAITAHRVPKGNHQGSANSVQDRGFPVRQKELIHLWTDQESHMVKEATEATPNRDAHQVTGRGGLMVTDHIQTGHVQKGHIQKGHIQTDRTLTDHIQTDHILREATLTGQEGHSVTDHMERTGQEGSSPTDRQSHFPAEVSPDRARQENSARRRISVSSAMRTRAESAG